MAGHRVLCGFNGEFVEGSIGPNTACFVMTIPSAPRQMSVPPLSAFEETITSKQSQNWRMRFATLHDAMTSPPLV